RDWFDLAVMITVEGRQVAFADVFKAIAKGKTKIKLVDNTYLSLDRPEFERLHALIHEAQALQEWDTGELGISRYQAGLWAELEELAGETEQAAAWRSAVSGLLELESVEPAPLPAGLQAELRPYQVQGYNWLAFLWEHGLGGVLADDMGLGKTLQTLALIARAREVQAAGSGGAAAAGRPFLVVAPTSVVPNWISEAARFTPGLRTVSIPDTSAKSRRKLGDLIAGADIVVTSYAVFRLDFAAYRVQDWDGLILDEAQFVKNRTTRANQCARDLPAPFKLAITGTPMENGVGELWSIFDFVLPGYLPGYNSVLRKYQDGENAADLL
ncbi:MAG: SNF2-related protein, partial [Arthrobacter sp.]